MATTPRTARRLTKQLIVNAAGNEKELTLSFVRLMEKILKEQGYTAMFDLYNKK